MQNPAFGRGGTNDCEIALAALGLLRRAVTYHGMDIGRDTVKFDK